MRRIVFLWIYRKEVLSLVYLFLVGMAFGAIWIFHDSSPPMVTVMAEGQNIIDVVATEAEKTLSPRDVIIPVPDRELVAPHRPKIVIIIDDMGVVRGRTSEIIKLAGPLTLSFLPYAQNLPDVTRFATAQGHELMVHLPMEPKGDKDPGPHALLTHSTDQKILQELNFNLSQFDGYVGLNNHMGSAFTEDRPGLALILREIGKRGLFVLDSRTSQKSILATMAAESNIPNMTRDLFLDNTQDVDYILRQLALLEDMARKRGNAIAIGHPYAATIEALTVWLPSLKEKGIVITPLSHIIKEKYEGMEMKQKADKLALSR